MQCVRAGSRRVLSAKDGEGECEGQGPVEIRSDDDSRVRCESEVD